MSKNMNISGVAHSPLNTIVYSGCNYVISHSSRKVDDKLVQTKYGNANVYGEHVYEGYYPSYGLKLQDCKNHIKAFPTHSRKEHEVAKALLKLSGDVESNPGPDYYIAFPTLQTLIYDKFDVDSDISFDLTSIIPYYTHDWEFIEGTSREDEFTQDFFLHVLSKRSRGYFQGGKFKIDRYLFECSRKMLIYLHENEFDEYSDISKLPYFQPDLGFMRLILSGDVELNPGPIPSKLIQHAPVIISFQEKMARFERERHKQNIKAKQARKALKNYKRELRDFNNQENQSLGDLLQKAKRYVPSISKSAVYFGLNSVIPGSGSALAMGIEGDRVRDICDSAGNSFNKIDKIVSKLEEDVPLLVGKHAVLSDCATKAFDAITHFMTTLNSAADKITDLATSTTKVFGNMTYIQILASILAVISVCLIPKKYYMLPIVLAILYMMGWHTDVITKIKYFFSQQENQSYSDYFPLIGQIVFTMLAFVGLKQIPDDNYYTNLMRRLDLLPKAITGVNKIWEHAGTVFNIASEEFQVYFLNKERTDLSITEQRALALAEVVARIEHWNDALNRKKLQIDTEAVKEVALLFERVNRWQHSSTQWQAFTPEEKRIILSIKPTINDLYKLICKSSVYEGGFRNVPLAVLLTGGTGLGKSRLLDPLSIALMSYRKLKPRNNIYVRASETEFWDGYHGQKLVQVDEFGQVKDTVGKPNPDMMEAMRMINNAPYPLHCADIIDKGTFFTSEIVLFASNISHRMGSYLNSLVFPQAALRRLAVHAYRVVPKAREVFCMHPDSTSPRKIEYPYCKLVGKNWVVDPTKVGFNPLTPNQGCSECKKDFYEDSPKGEKLREIGSVAFCKHHYCFERYDIFDDHVIQENISYDELLDMIKVEDAKTQQGQKDLLSTYDAFIDHPELFFNQNGGDEDFEEVTDVTNWVATVDPKAVCNVGAVDLADPFDFASFQFYLSFRNYCQRYYGRNYDLDLENVHLQNLPMLMNMYDRVTQCGFVPREENEFGTSVWDQLSQSAYFDSLFKGFIRKDESCFQRAVHSITAALRRVNHQISEWWSTTPTFELITYGVTFFSFLGFGAATCALYSAWEGSMDVCYLCKQCMEDCNCEEELMELQDLLYVKKQKNWDFDTLLHNLYESESGEVRLTRQNPNKVESGEVRLTRKNLSKVESGEVRLSRKNPSKVESGEVRLTRKANAKVESGEVRLTRRNANRVENLLQASKNDLENEGVTDMNAHAQVQNLLRHNIYMMHDDTRELGNVIMLTGRILLMPYHYYSNCFNRREPTDEFHLSNISGRNLITVSVRDLMKYVRLTKNGEEQDAVLVEIDNINNKVSHHKNIVKLFMTNDEQQALVKNGEYEGYLPVMDDILEPHLNFSNRTARLGYQLIHCRQIQPYFDRNAPFSILQGDGTTLQYRRYYSYFANTVKGNCGAPLVLYHRYLTHKLVGIHVTGSSTNHATSQVITQEMLKEGLSKLSRDAQCCIQVDGVTPIDLEVIRCDDVPCEGLIVHGKLPHKIVGGTNTKITPSPLHDVIAPALTKPTFSVNVKEKDSMYKGLVKYTANPPRLQPGLLKMATEDVSNLMHINWLDKDPRNYMRVLTYEEAVLGTEDEYIAPLNRKSSCSYPWTVKYPHLTGKKQVFGSDEWTLDTPLAKEVRQAVLDLEQKCYDGIQTDVLWTDTLKDERRPKGKVDDGKIRVFCAGPVHFTILFRMYFLGFAAWTMHSRNVNGVSTGTNVYSEDWDIIVQKLLSKGKNIVAGDFTNFDGTLNQQIVWALFWLIDSYYQEYESEEEYDRNHRIRYVLWMHIAQAVHVCGSIVYNVTHCQPSGCPLTAILNSWYFLILCRIVYLLCAIKYENDKMLRAGTYANMETYNKYVAEVSYGDDNTVAIHDSIVEFFNQQTMTDAFLACGHVYTDEAKSGKAYVTRNLEEIAYLKRKFIWDDMAYRYIAPLDLDVVLEIPQWTKRGTHERSIFLGNVDIALRELSLHGEETFQKYVKILKKEFQKRKIVYDFRSFSEYKTSVLEIDNWTLNESNEEEWIVHCVSADFALRKGFASQLLEKRPQAKKFVEKMRKRPHKVGYVAIDNQARVIHLVTKLQATDQPLSNSGLARCLRNLNKFNFSGKLICPMLGCGLDGRLNGMNHWSQEQLSDYIQNLCPNLVVEIQGPGKIFQVEENSEFKIDENCYQDNELCFLALPPKMARGSPTISREPQCESSV